jgi:Pvc16 N-terminal domain
MSSFEAIGGVSASLKTLLVEEVDQPPGLGAPLNPIPVAVGMPPEDDDIDNKPLLNLFLYRVTENGYLKNQEIPGRGFDGTAYGYPPLSLNLHYLLTAYGSTKSQTAPPLVDDFIAHYLLGSAMRVLHDIPVITEELETSGGVQILDASLRGEYESVKLTLEPISLEDVAKVWTALNRPYRLSAGYEVSVVQIESEAERSYPLRVEPLPLGPRVRAVAARNPQIDAVHAATRVGPYVRVGEILVLTGSALVGDPTLAWLGELDVSGSVTSATDERVTILVPDDPALQPGVLPVRVAHGLMLGEPPVPHLGMHSNTAAFVLVPKIDSVTRVGGTNLRIRGNRLLTPDVECMILVGTKAVPSSDYTGVVSPDRFDVPIPAGAQAGDRVRVRVNGAESLDDMKVPP